MNAPEHSTDTPSFVNAPKILDSSILSIKTWRFKHFIQIEQYNLCLFITVCSFGSDLFKEMAVRKRVIVGGMVWRMPNYKKREIRISKLFFVTTSHMPYGIREHERLCRTDIFF
jgi:hypothetical protein